MRKRITRNNGLNMRRAVARGCCPVLPPVRSSYSNDLLAARVSKLEKTLSSWIPLVEEKLKELEPAPMPSGYVRLSDIYAEIGTDQ